MNAIPHPEALHRTERSATRPLDLAALTGAAAWQRLSPAIRRRFAAAHHDTVYAGAMDLRASFIGCCHAAAATLFGGPLIAHRASGVPVTVRVQDDGDGGVVWERALALPGAVAPRALRSTKRLEADGALHECVQGGLSMRLRVTVEQGALVFTSTAYFLRLGRWRCPVPAWLAPGVCRVEHRDEGPGRFRFTLTMTHRWWGETFHQTGVFADPEQTV
jgi:hypothetical protein